MSQNRFLEFSVAFDVINSSDNFDNTLEIATTKKTSQYVNIFMIFVIVAIHSASTDDAEDSSTGGSWNESHNLMSCCDDL